MKMSILLNKVNADLLAQFGAKHMPITPECVEKVYSRNVLGFSVDAKTKKGLSKGFLTGILYLAPAALSGVNVCPWASKGCKKACLFSAGRGRFYSVTRARIVKTLAWHLDAPRFHATIKKSVKSLLVKAKNKGLTPCVRLNGTSDILWELNSDIIQSFPGVTFYDYTKSLKRLKFSRPANYHLTFSLSESNETQAIEAMALGINVAAVFRKVLPATLWNYPVISGDSTDLRFTDQAGAVIGLTAKGKAKQDVTGFVRD